MICLLLAGCPDLGPMATGPEVTGPVVPARNPVVSVAIPRPRIKPPTPPLADAGSPAQTGQASPATPSFDPPPLDPATALVGLDEARTMTLLGPPLATAEDPPARVWLYAKGKCAMNVYFFMDMASKDFRALSYDMKSGEDVSDADQRCFARFVAQAGDRAHD